MGITTQQNENNRQLQMFYWYKRSSVSLVEKKKKKHEKYYGILSIHVFYTYVEYKFFVCDSIWHSLRFSLFL